jgi:tetratricopeptide (TPR) repeat protein
LTQVDGSLATAYLHQGALQPALTAINDAIASNERIPDELYFVPRDLAIKAEIMARLGDSKSAIILYEKSADMLDAYSAECRRRLSNANCLPISARSIPGISSSYAIKAEQRTHFV